MCVCDTSFPCTRCCREVITDITRRMGEGMAEFIEKEVVTIRDYDLYCHYVAGLVGIGLSQLFASSALESQAFAKREDLSNCMGLFLQKTNIIRDYLEDIMEEPAPRMFWPREIWGEYGRTLADFKVRLHNRDDAIIRLLNCFRLRASAISLYHGCMQPTPDHRCPPFASPFPAQEPKNSDQAVACLNEMVNNALEHVPGALEYMIKLQNYNVFRFCAIPQVMAIGTLALWYDRRGQ